MPHAQCINLGTEAPFSAATDILEGLAKQTNRSMHHFVVCWKPIKEVPNPDHLVKWKELERLIEQYARAEYGQPLAQLTNRVQEAYQLKGSRFPPFLSTSPYGPTAHSQYHRSPVRISAG